MTHVCINRKLHQIILGYSKSLDANGFQVNVAVYYALAQVVASSSLHHMHAARSPPNDKDEKTQNDDEKDPQARKGITNIWLCQRSLSGNRRKPTNTDLRAESYIIGFVELLLERITIGNRRYVARVQAQLRGENSTACGRNGKCREGVSPLPLSTIIQTPAEVVDSRRLFD